MPGPSIVKATSNIVASVPKLQGRLGGFHIIIVAAFTLLGFYVCFKQMRVLTAEVASIRNAMKKGGSLEIETAKVVETPAVKAQVPDIQYGLPQTAQVQVQDHSRGTAILDTGLSGPGYCNTVQQFTTQTKQFEEDDYGFEEIDAQEIRDAGLRDMLKDLVSSGSCNSHANGVTVVIGTDTKVFDQGQQVRIVEEIKDQEQNEQVEPNENKENHSETKLDNIESLSVKDLKIIAAERGIPVKQGTKKSELISLIREADSVIPSEE
jgi:hypothetical protein